MILSRRVGPCRSPADREKWLLSRDRKSSEQFTCFNRRDHEMEAELALSGIVPSMRSDANQEAAIQADSAYMGDHGRAASVLGSKIASPGGVCDGVVCSG